MTTAQGTATQHGYPPRLAHFFLDLQSLTLNPQNNHYGRLLCKASVVLRYSKVRYVPAVSNNTNLRYSDPSAVYSLKNACELLEAFFKDYFSLNLGSHCGHIVILSTSHRAFLCSVRSFGIIESSHLEHEPLQSPCDRSIVGLFSEEHGSNAYHTLHPFLPFVCSTGRNIMPFPVAVLSSRGLPIRCDTLLDGPAVRYVPRPNVCCYLGCDVAPVATARTHYV